MDFLEKDLEDLIEELETDPKLAQVSGQIIDTACPLNRKKVFRQKRIGNYGIADLIVAGFHKSQLVIRLYELKKDTVNLSTLIQILRYRKGIKIYLNSRGIDNIRFDMYCIGKKVCIKNSWIYIMDWYYDNYTEMVHGDIVYFMEYSYGWSGLKLNEIHVEDYQLVDGGLA